jgi:cell division GTPase FtsZ
MKVSDNEEKTTERTLNFLFKPFHYEKNFHYEKIKEALEDLELSVEDIESVIIKDNEQLIEGETDEENNIENND